MRNNESCCSGLSANKQPQEHNEMSLAIKLLYYDCLLPLNYLGSLPTFTNFKTQADIYLSEISFYNAPFLITCMSHKQSMELPFTTRNLEHLL